MPLIPPTARTMRSRIFLRVFGRDIPLTDFTTISVIRILIEECFIEELQRLWAALVRSLRDWFIQTAQGAALDRRIADFDLVRPAAEPAIGTLSVFVAANNVLVPAGAVVETSTPDGGEPKRYQVLANPARSDGAWEIDLPSGTVRIRSERPGVVGNTAANTVTVLRTAIADVTEVRNLQPFVNGRDQATDEEFRQYFRDSLASLTRGPRDSIDFRVRNYTDATGLKPVHSVALLEWGGQTLLNLSGRPVALVIYIEDGSGSASPELVDEIQHFVDGDDSEGSGLRAAGVPTEVRSAAPFPMNFDVLIDAERSANPVTVRQEVEHAIREYVSRLPVGGQLITGELQGQLVFAQLFRRMMDVPGVLRARVGDPVGDRPIPIGQKAIAATVNVAVQTVT